jgi:hypothetical protein
LAALDVHQTRVLGRSESKCGIAPFDRLVDQVMTRPPYDKARRVESIAKPFQWKFTRQDVMQLLSKTHCAAA